jgi:hypothetical protein
MNLYIIIKMVTKIICEGTKTLKCKCNCFIKFVHEVWLGTLNLTQK